MRFISSGFAARRNLRRAEKCLRSVSSLPVETRTSYCFARTFRSLITASSLLRWLISGISKVDALFQFAANLGHHAFHSFCYVICLPIPYGPTRVHGFCNACVVFSLSIEHIALQLAAKPRKLFRMYVRITRDGPTCVSN